MIVYTRIVLPQRCAIVSDKGLSRRVCASRKYVPSVPRGGQKDSAEPSSAGPSGTATGHSGHSHTLWFSVQSTLLPESN